MDEGSSEYKDIFNNLKSHEKDMEDIHEVNKILEKIETQIELSEKKKYKQQIFNDDDETFEQWLESYYQKRRDAEHDHIEYLKVSITDDDLNEDYGSKIKKERRDNLHKSHTKHNKKVHTLDDLPGDDLMDMLLGTQPKKKNHEDDSIIKLPNKGRRLKDGQKIIFATPISQQIERMVNWDIESILRDEHFESNLFLILCSVLFLMMVISRIKGFISGYKYARKKQQQSQQPQQPQIIVVPTQMMDPKMLKQVQLQQQNNQVKI